MRTVLVHVALLFDFVRAAKMLGVWGDGMVLQHNKPLVHGCTESKRGRPENVTIQVANSEVNSSTVVLTDSAGCFVASLPPLDIMRNGSDAATVSVIADDDTVLAKATRVLFGVVILCSGQSNMVHPVSYDYNATAQIAAAHLLPNVRLLQVGRQWATEAEVSVGGDFNASWSPLGCVDGQSPNLTPNCSFRNQWWSPLEHTYVASFSAVCYFTAQELLRNELGTDAAVGLVESDWGGSAMEAWLPKQDIEPCAAPGSLPAPEQCLHNETDPTKMTPIRTNSLGCLYRGMLLPLAPSLRPSVVLWYQGEANQGEVASFYGCVFAKMVEEFRKTFANSALPFYWVQLAPYFHKESMLFPHIRVAQAEVTPKVDTFGTAGFACVHDRGDQAGGIHPHDKTTVGIRLSYPVRRGLFGTKDLPHVSQAVGVTLGGSGEAMAGSTGKVTFSGTATSLRWGPTHDCQQCCNASQMVVEVCTQGANECSLDNDSNATVSKLWTPVAAAVTGTVLEFSTPAGLLEPTSNDTHPTQTGWKMTVRYAWSDYPQCVLFDQNELPIGPFHLVAVQ